MRDIDHSGFFAVLCFIAYLGASETEAQEPIPRDGLRRELVGCYALFGDDERPVDSSGYYNASPRVRLDSLPVSATVRDNRPGIVRVLHRLNAGGRRQAASSPIEFRSPAWSADSLTDSIRLSFSNGLSGASFILAAPSTAADTLEGRAEEHWDFGPPFETPRGRARAVRVRCAP